MRYILWCCVVAMLSLAAASGPGQAAILLDFGSTAYSGADSPAHAVGAATGTGWNSLATDTSSGFVDEHGDPVLGLSVDFGVETAVGSKTVDYAGATKAASYTGSGTYALFDSALGTDHVVRDSGPTVGVALAVRGLPAGSYDVYVTGFRGDNGGNAGKIYRTACQAAAADVTDWAGSTFAVRPNATKAPAGKWIENDNYLKFTVTLDAGAPNLYVFDRSDSYIGVLNSLEIAEAGAAVPPLLKVDFENGVAAPNVSLNQYNADTGQHWQGLFGADAADSGDVTAGAGVRLADSTVAGRGYFLAGVPGEGAMEALAWTDDAPAVDVADLETLSARLNNKSAADAVRFAVRVAGQWYASDEAFGIDPPGVGYDDWSNSRQVSLDVATDAAAWRVLDVQPGTALALGAASPADLAGMADAFGVFLEVADGGLVRLDDFTVIPEPATLAVLALGGGLLAMRRRRR